MNYYEALLPRLRPGGLLAADNVLWSGKVLDPREKSDHAIVAFNTHVARDPRVEHVLLDVGQEEINIESWCVERTLRY